MRTPLIIENLPVESYANEGKCIAHHEGKVVFVKGSIPGEVVTVKISRSKKDWMEGEVLHVIHPSPQRQIPFCMHFGYCGGCQWQHMNYATQLHYKELGVVETLERMGKINAAEKLPIAGCDTDHYYRNKLEFAFSHREWLQPGELVQRAGLEFMPALGYHLPGAFDRVYDVKECFLQPQPSDRIRIAVKQYACENGLRFFDLRNQVGLLRNLMIRVAVSGEVMVLVVFAERNEEQIFSLMEFLKTSFPEITSLQYTINQKRNDTIYDLEIITYSGNNVIYEMLGDLKFQISAKSFFQTNTRQAKKLYDCVKDFCELQGNELLYDFYTGTGSIALYLARYCNQIIGIESVAQAIEDAKVNAALNNIGNVSFYTADIAKVFNQEFYQEHGTPDILITDPPRAGMHPDVVKELLQMQPKKIIYVSCNVATQARDLQMLSEKYDVVRIKPFDLFPHTHHIENVAELICRL